RAVGRVPVLRQVVRRRRRARIEVVVVVAVEEVGVRRRAHGLHGRARAVVVAHAVGGVVAVAVLGGMGRRRLHPTERVHEFVGLDGLAAHAPTTAVDPGELTGDLGAAVADVVVSGLVVVVHLG